MDRRGHNPSFPRHSKPSNLVAMNAVAFQDHWARSLAISNPIGPRQVGLGPATRAKQKKEIRSVVDTGRSKAKPKPSQPVEKEYVLDEKPPPLTLAQKLGLVDAPTQHLSETDWSQVKAKSNARDDSKEPCVICKEDFGLQQQVLLSCSHVFHRACLQAFERYTGKKTCPMCRREQYQTRVIHEGAKMHKQTSATRIQAAWRGYVVRSWYKKLRETVPPKDPKLRKKFYIEKLEGITDRMVRSCDFDVNSFLQEIDHSLERSRDIFRHFDAVHRTISEEEWEAIQLKAVERANQDCPICLTSLTLTCPTTPDPASDLYPHPDSTSNMQHSNSAVPKVTTPASKSSPPHKPHPSKTHAGRKAGSTQGAGDGVDKEKTTMKKTTSMKARRAVLLSCSHVFHETCLLTLEELAMGDIRNICPVCRAMYQKRALPAV